jgi:hypothetical protein
MSPSAPVAGRRPSQIVSRLDPMNLNPLAP